MGSAKFLVVAVLLVLLTPVAQASGSDQPLTNEDVIKLHEAGLPATVIVAKIRSTVTVFDTSVDALVALGEAGIPDKVIAVMVNPSGGQTAGAVASQPQSQQIAPQRVVVAQQATLAPTVAANFAGTPCSGSGIFAETDDGLEALRPRSASGGGGSSAMVSALARGIIGNKSYAFLSGTRARTQLYRQVSFLFCFEETHSGMSYQTEGAVIPDDFILAQLEVREKKGKRRLQTGNFHIWKGNKQGTPDDDRIPFTIEDIAPGVYRVIPGYLLPGEYAFYYSAELGTAVFGVQLGDSGKFFDFGVSG